LTRTSETLTEGATLGGRAAANARPGMVPARTGRVRTAVIVAAGKGGRLVAPDAPPKPLLPVVGVPLVRRVMAAAAKAGIRRFVVVVGYKADVMRARLPALVPADAALELIENPRFEEPNGVSLLAAARAVDEPFALLMSDHVFSADRLARALERFHETQRALLVVEDARSFTGDVDDATRVSVAAGKVTAIGKDLAAFDAIDTGRFVLRPEDTIDALERAGPSPSISDGIRLLAREGELDAWTLEGGFWQDVDTPADVALAERRLYGALTKTTDGFLARLINRRVSLFLSTRLWRFGVTPNMVTSFTLLLGLGAGVAFAQGSSAAWGLLGATLFQLQSIVLAAALHGTIR
jgi:choline kinase